jgi:hypothetical protein
MQSKKEAGSPIAEWAFAFLSATFAKIESLEDVADGHNVALSLHDPLCIWYVTFLAFHSNQCMHHLQLSGQVS